jgi:LemA protein
MEMLKKFLPWIIAVVVIIGIYSWVKGINNTAVTYEQDINESWGNVQTTYQRRADLIPNLVSTVKGAAANEKDILINVTNARAGISNFDPSQINQEIGNAKNPQQLDVAGKKINTAINLAFEAYPQIRSTEAFIRLQDDITGTENRINKARQDYNDAIELYNTHISGFLNSTFLNKSLFPYIDETFGYFVTDAPAGKLYNYIESDKNESGYALSRTITKYPGFGTSMVRQGDILIVSQPDPFGELSQIYIYKMFDISKSIF